MRKQTGVILTLVFGSIIIFLLIYLFRSGFFKHQSADHQSKNNQMTNHQSGHAHSDGDAHASNEKQIYTCPMHPEIRESRPGSCPICHMKLVKVVNESNKNIKGSNKNDTESEISLNISPYQSSLVGLKPIKVLKKEVEHLIPISGRIISKTSLALQVFEKDLRYIKSGVKFYGRSEVFPEDLIKGEISSIDNLADPSSRTVRVLGRITDSGRNSLSESSFTGEVIVALGEKLVVPEKSILFTGQGDYVYLYQEEVLQPKRVSLGPKVGEEYVILDGLNENDNISSGPNFLIDSESKIRGLSTKKSNPNCPKGQKWNEPMSMCMTGETL